MRAGLDDVFDQTYTCLYACLRLELADYSCSYGDRAATVPLALRFISIFS